MGGLTNKEREGLEDVFLCIHTDNHRNYKFQKIYTLISNQNIDFLKYNIYKGANFGLKRVKISYFFNKITKKKKYLSK